jgi:hypothetical protein
MRKFCDSSVQKTALIYAARDCVDCARFNRVKHDRIDVHIFIFLVACFLEVTDNPAKVSTNSVLRSQLDSNQQPGTYEEPALSS